MKKSLCLILIACLVTSMSHSQSNIIPSPKHAMPAKGTFAFSQDVSVTVPAEMNETAGIFADEILKLTGARPEIKAGTPGKGDIDLIIDRKITGREEYELNISPGGIELRASTGAGLFYGLQTIRQLLILSGKPEIPAMIIKDSPRFEWRGVMLDVSRTFMPVNLVKRYIDLFALYKLNVLHLHLTDDQGWRIEIKKYPLLTEVGSRFDAKYNCMGGYYSQVEIRDLVRYAGMRNITIVPEIELPGHACAALASYPWLSCSGIEPEIHTFFEGPGVHNEIFCAGKPEVYQFIFNVLDEIAGLFPSNYIHIGGDEAPKEEWKKCSFCQKIIRDNNLNNEEELQSYFVKRIGEHLRTKNKLLTGWDEIYDGGRLKGDEILMYWRGWKAESVEKAAAQGFRIVASPTTHCYFDYDYGKINTRTIFDYDPVPKDASSEIRSRYIGVQANFWSHIDRSEYNIDKQLFPRIFGLAETAWSIPGNHNWNEFRQAALKNGEYLKSRYINVFPDESLVEMKLP